MTFERIKRDADVKWSALRNSEIPCVFIGTATCCCAAGALEVRDYFIREQRAKRIDAHIIETGCMGFHSLDPMVIIAKHGRSGICYAGVTEDMASRIIAEYLLNDNPIPDLALCSVGTERQEGIPDLSQLPMFKSQVRIAARNCGWIDPEDINHYIAHSGYKGLDNALKMTPEAVIEEIGKSGLSGRGGAGFLTAEKWRSCRVQPSNEKYIICNAAEGDPSACGIRFLMEGDPHSVLEGMLIGAYAVGASRGYVVLNGEYALANKRLDIALEQMGNLGLLGDHVLDSDFNFGIEILRGSGSFVCGEETVLINAVEGKRESPTSRPPYPSESGLRGKPTVVNNAETLAHVSVIMQEGVGWYMDHGAGKSGGTKIFTLSGNVAHSGTIEVPMDMTLRQIVYDMAGGIPEDGEFKAIQTGGPTGGWLPAEMLDLPVDYAHLTDAGSIMGSGSLLVADSNSCAVDMARRAMVFLENESCGKCVFCREGTMQLAQILSDITGGKGRPQDMELLLKLSGGMKKGSFCAMGRTAPNPVLTTIEHFREEYEAHIKENTCLAKGCKQ